ncbi:MAG TPA: quinone-dependent dihydroorotate dehydrogenase [Sporichthyaceae bacterium]|jgi:dihydroorotate dehydrogenase
MSAAYEALLRRAMFAAGGGDPEAVHHRVITALAKLGGIRLGRRALERIPRPSAPVEAFGLCFPNPVGLAAGMDKDGVAIPAWAALGFGFVEVGTVTRYPQPGNAAPRLFRLVESEAIVNRMGFNNAGAAAMAVRLSRLGPRPIPVGVSLGKSKITAVTDATEDYLNSLELLLPHADYVAVNVSSPNTPGLRSLQDRAALDELLAALRRHTVAQAGPAGPTPLLLKIAPDLTDRAVAEILEVCANRGVAGIIATNTTLARDGLASADVDRGAEAGGLSGRPLRERALAMVEFVVKEAGDTLPVIGVGGILEPDDALRMLDVGARLVQLYTGFVYRGPGLVRAISAAAAQRPARI